MIPFFAFPPAARRAIYTTNAIESINARLRKIIKTRATFRAINTASVGRCLACELANAQEHAFP